jgi:hypothetical protein
MPTGRHPLLALSSCAVIVASVTSRLQDVQFVDVTDAGDRANIALRRKFLLERHPSKPFNLT